MHIISRLTHVWRDNLDGKRDDQDEESGGRDLVKMDCGSVSCNGYFRHCRGASMRPAFRLSRSVNLDERCLSRAAVIAAESRPPFDGGRP